MVFIEIPELLNFTYLTMNFHNHQHANHYAQGYCVITQMVDARVKTIVEFNVKFYDKKQDQERRGG